jgi:hypothetical protein
MARGIPKSKGSDIAALPYPRLDNVPLIGIGAFQVTSRKKSDRTGKEYDKDEIKLSLDFDSGHIMRDTGGNPVLDDDGNERPHLINIGFVTLSGHAKANFVAIIKALGFNDKRFIVNGGPDAGSLTDEAMESVEVVFGTNGLGDDYSGSEWIDLPFYVVGGDQGKRDVEVPVLSFKILGFELIGRRCDMTLKIDDKGYNRVELFMPPRDVVPLGGAPKPVRGISKPVVEDDDDRSPFDIDPPAPVPEMYPTPTSKAALYVHKRMEAAEIPIPMRVRVAQLVSGMDDFTSIANISTAAAKNIQDMLKVHPESLTEALGQIFAAVTGSDADFDEEEDL